MIRIIVDAPWYVTNETLHKDLSIPTVKEEISRMAARYKSRLENHPNILASSLTNTNSIKRRLKRKIPQDLFRHSNTL